MHIVKNLDFQYQMNVGWVKSVDEERDLGVLTSKDLKFSKQCLLAKNEANLMLGIINRGVAYKSVEVLWNYIDHSLDLRVLHTVLEFKKFIVQGRFEKGGYVVSLAWVSGVMWL